MDKETAFIRNHLIRLICLHNLVGYVRTLTYDDVFFVQCKLRKIIKGIEDDLGIVSDSFANISPIPATMDSKKYLSVDE